MAEDCLCVGFEFFDLNQEIYIANENAVRNAAQRLQNEVAYNAAIEHLGQAQQSVSEAARKKAARQEPDDPPPPEGFTEGTDFFIL